MLVFKQAAFETDGEQVWELRKNTCGCPSKARARGGIARDVAAHHGWVSAVWTT